MTTLKLLKKPENTADVRNTRNPRNMNLLLDLQLHQLLDLQLHLRLKDDLQNLLHHLLDLQLQLLLNQ